MCSLREFCSRYIFTVSENAPRQTLVGQVFAYDRDAAPFNTFKFYLDTNEETDGTTIAVHPASQLFQVDPKTGEIYTRHTLDREDRDAYNLTVVVQWDKPGNSQQKPSDVTLVTIFIQDTNDRGPVILFPNIGNDTIHISSSTTKDQLIATVVALDPDVGTNAHLTYSITGGNSEERFYINPQNGDVHVRDSLADADGTTAQLEVLVQDSGLPPHTTLAVLKINIGVVLPTGSLVDRDFFTWPISGVRLTIMIAAVTTSIIIVAISLVAVVAYRCQRNKQSEMPTRSGTLTADIGSFWSNPDSVTTPPVIVDDLKDALDVRNAGSDNQSDSDETGDGNNETTNVEVSQQVYLAS